MLRKLQKVKYILDDQRLTDIEKGNLLIDTLNRTTTSVAENNATLSDHKDTKLF